MFHIASFYLGITTSNLIIKFLQSMLLIIPYFFLKLQLFLVLLKLNLTFWYLLLTSHGLLFKLFFKLFLFLLFREIVSWSIEFDLLRVFLYFNIFFIIIPIRVLHLLLLLLRFWLRFWLFLLDLDLGWVLVWWLGLVFIHFIGGFILVLVLW